MKALVRMLLSVLALSSSAAFAAKPPAPPSGCASAGGTFPSIVYFVPVVTSGGVLKSRDIYLGNSLGNCAVKVYSMDGTTRPPHNLSMSFDGVTGRIVWDQGEQNGKNQPAHAVIKMAEFHVIGGQITNTLPLTTTNVYRDPLDVNAANIADVNISTAGDAIVFARVTAEFELKLLDTFACVSSCPVSNLYAGGLQSGVGGSVFAPGVSSRVYFSWRPTGAEYGLYVIDKQGDTWMGPALLLSVGDDSYWHPGRIIRGPSTTILSSREVVAFGWGHPGNALYGVDVLDVTDCSAAEPGSCLQNLHATWIKTDIPVSWAEDGWRGDGALLIPPVDAANQIHAIDPTSLEVVTDYGPGHSADGVK